MRLFFSDLSWNDSAALLMVIDKAYTMAVIVAADVAV